MHSTLLQVPGPHQDQRDHLQVRLGQPAPQPADRDGPGHDRRHRDTERQAVPGHQLQRRQRRRAHVLDPDARDQRAALRQQRQRESLQPRAVHHELAPPIIKFSFETPGSWQLPLAVLRALRPPVGCTAMVGRCRPSAAWTVSCRSSRDRRRRDSSRGAGRAAATGSAAAEPTGARVLRRRSAPLVAHPRRLVRALGDPRPALLFPGRTPHPPGDDELDRRRGTSSTSTSFSSLRCR